MQDKNNNELEADVNNKRATCTNVAEITGCLLEAPTENHAIRGEKFFLIPVSAKRMSGVEDILNVIVSEKLMPKDDLNKGDTVTVRGQLRTYNHPNEQSTATARSVGLCVFAKSEIKVINNVQQIAEIESEINNSIHITGFICKKPFLKEVSDNRYLTSVCVAVQRMYRKSDYIPCIIWGRDAVMINQKVNVGDKVEIWGRLQSRDYPKYNNETKEDEMLRTYELSASRIEILESNVKEYSDYDDKADV